MLKRLPFILIYARLLAGLLLLLWAVLVLPHYALFAISLLVFGLLSDVFDGIIARKLNISSERLRRMDSTIDQVFFICCGLATYFHCPAFFRDNMSWLLVLLSVEALTYVVSFIKFRKEVATHSIGAKIWTLTLVATLVELTIHCKSAILFPICFWAGMLTRMEIIAILLTIRKWTNDVPSIYHAWQLRKGKEIKRNKLFNG